MNLLRTAGLYGCGQGFFADYVGLFFHGMTIGLALIAFAVVDAFYQWWNYEKT